MYEYVCTYIYIWKLIVAKSQPRNSIDMGFGQTNKSITRANRIIPVQTRPDNSDANFSPRKQDKLTEKRGKNNTSSIGGQNTRQTALY